MGEFFKGWRRIVALAAVILLTAIRFRCLMKHDTIGLTQGVEHVFVRSGDDSFLFAHHVKRPPQDEIDNRTGKWYVKTDNGYEDDCIIWCPYLLLHAFAAVVYLWIAIGPLLVKPQVAKPNIAVEPERA